MIIYLLYTFWKKIYPEKKVQIHIKKVICKKNLILFNVF